MRNKKDWHPTKDTVENVRHQFSKLWLSQSGFEDLLKESGFVSKVIEHYRTELFERWQFQPWNEGKDTTNIKNHIEGISKLLQEHLGKRLYYTTALLIDQSWRDKHGKPMSKKTARMLANFYFVESGLADMELGTNKGRPRKTTKIGLQQQIETTVGAFKLKYNGVPPTMAQIAKLLRISLPALKMRIKREGLQWKELREVT